ncbi:hypothetical protein LOTGIDRAFT_220717 [Lottia gigantea]|uniref:Uncharacterized protein n=1 Tax=Lottia gigantea TaxID=225164 RepID=V4BDC0_LOTGI|nr:hypothetical protein LOTGIDRAFT_220717 [Lottia gigantea]ESO86404.1 hypothetical protein LOTGIDRAFT_220717 [Lottia gigantea]
MFNIFNYILKLHRCSYHALCSLNTKKFQTFCYKKNILLCRNINKKKLQEF